MKNKMVKKVLLSFMLTVLFCGCSAEAWHPGDTTTVSVSRVSLNKATLSLQVGVSETLTATIVPTNATNKAVTWRSNNTSVATVSGGLVRAVAAGSATVTVTTSDGNKTATCAVTVTSGNVPVSYVSLNKTSMKLTVGISETLTATITPSNATNKAVTWSNSNTAVATVSASGAVTAVATGRATITVTTVDGNKIDFCTVTVTRNSESKTLDLGYFTVENNPTQKGWCTDGVDGISTSLIIDDLSDAKFLVLELNTKPTGGFDMIWQGTGNDWSWDQQDGILSNEGEPNAQLGATILEVAGKVILKIELSKALKNYNLLASSAFNAKFYIAYYSPDIEGLGITRAYLEF
jgi:post-segregation antitoxin (ccd killing protein)